MAFSKSDLHKIKTIAQKFINEDGMSESEEGVQASYILQVLRILGWESDNWKINKTQDVKTGKRTDIILKGLSGGAIFVIESKEPKKSLDDRYKDKTYIEQLCNYCNAEGLYWGVLTNFVEWRIYSSYQHELYFNNKYHLILDKDSKPRVNHDDDEKLFKLFTELEFAKLRAKKGRIDSNPIYYKKTNEIRDEFFTSLKDWRKQLRIFIHKKYRTKYSDEQIDNQTQKILDRLIFIQVCFKKDIISQDILGSVMFSEKKDYYDELIVKFKQLNEKFNTELFANDLCDSFQIDDDTTEDIIKGINSIDFSKVNPHIMGEVYEDYLGELLKESKKDFKLLELKEKKKKKEQGIYYTKEYIVDFIIENTLAEKLKTCNTEKDIEKIKVLDPACGSGSFLIKAYKQFLNAYTEKRQGKKSKSGSMFDDFEIRKKILLHNIFGIDLDERAVEIAKLNLFITALDGLKESNVTGIKILPNLSLNIRCGNSLISGVYKELTKRKKQLTIFDKQSELHDELEDLIKLKEQFYDEEDNINKSDLLDEIKVLEERINGEYNESLNIYFSNPEDFKPANLDVMFCEILKHKGFDVIIGNPPYGANFKEVEKKFLFKTYPEIVGQPESYEYFIFKFLKLLKEEGKFSFIVPTNFTESARAENLRKAMLDNGLLNIISNFRYKVWENNSSEPLVYIYTRTIAKGKTLVSHPKNEDEFKNQIGTKKLNQNQWYKTPKSRFLLRADLSFINEIEKNTVKLGTLCEVSQGIIPYKTREDGVENKYISNKPKEGWKRLMDTKSSLIRYGMFWGGNYLKYGDWLWCPREEKYFEQPKIIYGALRNKALERKLVGYFDDKKFYNRHNFNNIIKKENSYSLKYILGIFNSKLINVWFKSYFDNVNINPTQVRLIPIKELDFNNKSDKEIHKKIVRLVDKMQVLSKHPEKNKIKISALDLELDSCIYKLYGVSL